MKTLRILAASLLFSALALGLAASANSANAAGQRALNADLRDAVVIAQADEIQVVIDFNPRDDTNTVVPGSRFYVWVVILTTSEARGEPVTFDATTVDATSLLLNGAPPRAKSEGGSIGVVTDFDWDGDQDLGVNFRIDEMTISSNDTSVVIQGQTLDQRPVRGIDRLTVRTK